MKSPSKNSTAGDGKFGIEQLEGREVCAGGVLSSAVELANFLDQPIATAPLIGRMTATLSQGTLTITGDSTAHGLLVEQLGSHKFKLTGENYVNGIANTINGQSSVVFDGVTKDFIVQLGAETDAVVFKGKDESHQLKTPRDVVFSSNGGYDVFELVDVKIGRDVKATMGGEYGLADFVRTTIGRDAFIQTGPKHDVVDIFKTTVNRNLNVSTGGGGDGMYLTESTVKGTALIQAGDGDDAVFLDHSTVKKDLYLSTGAGKDEVHLTAAQADQFFVDLGDGDDKLTLSAVKGKKGTFNGGVGLDSLYGAKSYQFSRTPSFQSFEFTQS